MSLHKEAAGGNCHLVITLGDNKHYLGNPLKMIFTEKYLKCTLLIHLGICLYGSRTISKAWPWNVEVSIPTGNYRSTLFYRFEKEMQRYPKYFLRK